MSSRKMFQVLVVTMALIFARVTVGIGQSPGLPISSRGIVPLFYNVGPEGNVICDQVGDYQMIRSLFGESDLDAGTTGTVTWSMLDNQFVAWDGMHEGLAIILRSENGINVYKYDESYTYDSGLGCPLSRAGVASDVSKIIFCWNPHHEKEK